MTYRCCPLLIVFYEIPVDELSKSVLLGKKGILYQSYELIYPAFPEENGRKCGLCRVHLEEVPAIVKPHKHKNSTPCQPAQVWKSTFWMAHYKSLFVKGHALYSNSSAINLFDLGKLLKRARRQGPKTVVKYVDKQGRKRYKGSRYLTLSENLDGN